MSDNVIRLATSNQSPAKRACSTCRHREWDSLIALHRCGALGFQCRHERADERGQCGSSGLMWEPIPPRQRGAFERAWRWLFGGRGE